MVWESTISSPTEALGQNTIQMQEYSVQLTLFGVRYKPVVTFTDSLKRFAAFESAFLCKYFAYFLAYWCIALNMQKCGKFEV